MLTIALSLLLLESILAMMLGNRDWSKSRVFLNITLIKLIKQVHILKLYFQATRLVSRPHNSFIDADDLESLSPFFSFASFFLLRLFFFRVFLSFVFFFHFFFFFTSFFVFFFFCVFFSFASFFLQRLFSVTSFSFYIFLGRHNSILSISSLLTLVLRLLTILFH